MKRRSFTAALWHRRCEAIVTLRDGSTASCMRTATFGTALCAQHRRMADGLDVSGNRPLKKANNRT